MSVDEMEHKGPSSGAGQKRAVWNGEALLVHRDDLKNLLVGRVEPGQEVGDDLDYNQGIRGFISGMLDEARYEIVYLYLAPRFIPWIENRLQSLGVEIVGRSEARLLEEILDLVRIESGAFGIEHRHDGLWMASIAWRGLGEHSVTGEDRERVRAMEQAFMAAEGHPSPGPSALHREVEASEESIGKLRRDDAQQLTDAMRTVPGFEEFSGTSSSTVAAAASLIRRLDPAFLAGEKPPRLSINEMRARVLAELSMLVQRARLDGTAEFMDESGLISDWKEYRRATEIASHLASIAADLEFTAPRREDAVVYWLIEHRDKYEPHSLGWAAIDNLLDDYRLHADTGTALDEDAGEP